MTLRRQRLGKSGEDQAVRELARRGYAILARRYRTRHGEIDIVAEDQGTLVFVEVKARATADYGVAADAVTIHKRHKLTSMAVEYLTRMRIVDRPCRFDVVAIDDVAGTPRITVIQGAFDGV
jgi:putative endonuclease